MAGINGIGGIPDPTPSRPVNTRDRKATETKSVAAQDDVSFSSQAQEAASLVRTAQQPDVRTDRVEAAKQSIERGDYKRPDIIAKVAERISRFFE